MLNKKLKKLINKPNLFFYDYFSKKVGIHTEDRSSLSKTAESVRMRVFSGMDLARLSPWHLLSKLVDWRSGVLTGRPDQSFLLRADQLRLFINAILEIAEFRQCGAKIFTLGGGYYESIEPNTEITQKIENRIFKNLSAKPDFVVEFPYLSGENFSLHIFIYEVNDQEQYIVRSSQAYIKKLAIHRMSDFYPSPLAPDNGAFLSRPAFPIDVVYTWVNKDDPSWQTLWNQTFPGNTCDPDRFTCTDELKYSLRALMKYAPWVRHIYIVSNCGKPEYIGNHKKLTWVEHKDIFPDETFLPTFNSHAIEACLHRIPNLAEHFIYFNDDVFLNQPCYPKHFFDEFGRSVSYLESYGMVTDDPSGPDSPDHLVAAKNSRKLLSPVFYSNIARQLHTHVPHSLRKSVLEEMENKFGNQFTTTRMAKLRSATDLNVTSFLYHHYALASGHAIHGNTTSLIVRPENIKKLLSENNDLKCRFLCFNDGNGSSLNNAYKEYFTKYCVRRLPYSCVLELHHPSNANESSNEGTWAEEIERVYEAARKPKEDEKRELLQKAALILKQIQNYIGEHEIHDINMALWKFKYLSLLGKWDEGISLLTRLAVVDRSFASTLKYYQALQYERTLDHSSASILANQLSEKTGGVKWVSSKKVSGLLDRLRIRQIAQDVIQHFQNGELSTAASDIVYYHGRNNIHFSSQLAFELLSQLRSLSELCDHLQQEKKKLSKIGKSAQIKSPFRDTRIIFSSGVGYSGSGAVSDYLRSFSNIVEPNYPYDELIFLGGRYGIGSIYAILRALDKSNWLEFSNSVTNFTLTAFLGLPFNLMEEGKFSGVKCTSTFALQRSLIGFLSGSVDHSLATNPDDLMKRAIQMVSELHAVLREPNMSLTSFYQPLSTFCIQMFQYAGWTDSQVLLINNGLTGDRLRVASLFPDAKFIITIRDPRDQFVSRALEAIGVNTSVEANTKLFSKRYTMLNASLKSHINPKNVAVIDFENFITDARLRKDLQIFCGLDLGDYLTEKSRFSPEISKKNIGIHSTWPNQEEIRSIFESLSPKTKALSKFKFSLLNNLEEMSQ